MIEPDQAAVVTSAVPRLRLPRTANKVTGSVVAHSADVGLRIAAVEGALGVDEHRQDVSMAVLGWCHRASLRDRTREPQRAKLMTVRVCSRHPNSRECALTAECQRPQATYSQRPSVVPRWQDPAGPTRVSAFLEAIMRSVSRRGAMVATIAAITLMTGSAVAVAQSATISATTRYARGSRGSAALIRDEHGPRRAQADPAAVLGMR